MTPSTIEACFRKCLKDPNIEIEPVPVPADFTRSAWESQIDLEAFTEEEIELEIQEIIQKNQSMAPDPAEPEKENLMTTSVAMTATRRLRSYFQCHSAPLEILQALAQVESQLLKDKIESKTAKQTTIKNFFVKPTGLPIQPQQQQNTPEKQQNTPEQQQSPPMSTKKCQQEPLQQPSTAVTTTTAVANIAAVPNLTTDTTYTAATVISIFTSIQRMVNRIMQA